MKATLTFKLPEEEGHHRSALDGARWKAVAGKINEWMRNEIKYKDFGRLEGARRALFEFIEEEGLTLD